MATYQVCGVQVSTLGLDGAAQLIADRAASADLLQVHLCNAYTLSLVDSDGKLRKALASADLNLPDGTPVAWIGRRHGVHGPVRGSSLMEAVARVGASGEARHYFYGGAPGVADAVAGRLRECVAGVLIAGAETPPYRELTSEELDDLGGRIRASGASILWLGLGTPRQDHLVLDLASRVKIPLVPVGAAFDFWAGNVREAPSWLHGSGLEWLYRLSREPRRLWKRYLLGNPRFVIAVWKHSRTSAKQVTR